MKKIISTLTALILGVSPLLATGAIAESTSKLSDRGSQSVKQLAACIQTADSLDVYYVVDMSTSLADTDPEKMRADILAEDVSRWGDVAELTSGLKVRVNGTFFAGSTEPFSGGWQEVNGANKNAVAKQIGDDVRKHPLQNYTNWLDALKTAEKTLSTSPAQCKAVVWFTDGGLWIGEGHSGNTKALSDLCGVQVPSSGTLPKKTSSTGLIQKLRDENVSIFGVLLNSEEGSSNAAEEAYWRSYMQTLVEESGPPIGTYNKLPSGEFVCGKNANGEDLDYPSGAFLQADSPSNVAYPFLLITSQVAGGHLTEIGADGNFWLDPAFKSFEILTLDENWRITDATGKIIKSSSEMHGVATTGRLPASVKKSEQWNFSGEGQLVLYPEISPELDPKTIFTGRDAQVSGHFVDSRSNDLVNLKLYKDASFKASVEGKDKSVDFNRKTGVYSFNSGKISSETVNFAFSLMLTTEHYSNIGPLNFLITEIAQNPANFPTVSEIKFPKKLESGKDSITSVVTLKGPEDLAAGEGTVCFNSVKITGDDQNELGAYTSRAETWKAAINPDGCVTVAAGSTKNVTLSISNSVPKSAHVSGVANYSLASSGNSEITLEDSRQFEFESGKQIDFGKIIGFFILAYLLSVGIPLLILYFLNRAAAKMPHGNEILRAAFPVELDTATRIATATQGKALTSAEIGMDEFKYRPPAESALSFEDSEGGTLKAVVPLFPLNAPWYEVVAKEGSTVVTGRVAPRGRQPRYASGRKAAFDGHLGKLWMLVIPTAGLLATTEENTKTSARLIVYGKTSKGVAPKFPELMANAASQLSILPLNYFNDIKKSLREEALNASKNQGKISNDKGSVSVSKKTGSVPPPPPGPGSTAQVPPRPPAGSGPSMPSPSSGPSTPPRRSDLPPPPPMSN